MLQALSFPFMQNALAAGVLASIACGLVGCLVVVNRLVFLAGGVAHAAYGGVGLAMLAGLPVLPAAVGFSLASSTAMAAATRRHPQRADTVIGAMWALGMAFGIVCVDFAPQHAGGLMSYLFGSILTVSRGDLLAIALLTLLITGLCLRFYRDFLAFSFDREFARTKGVPVTLLHYLLPAMTALAVVMVVQVVGLILVIALLTIPPALAERRTRSLGSMMALASVLGAAFCVLGVLAAYLLDVTSGAAVIGLAGLCYLADLALGGRKTPEARV
nr:metal ABC transporter permease [Desulfohalovibrio reitneri]